MASYYPRKVATFKDLKKLVGPEWEGYDEAEEDRLEAIKMHVLYSLAARQLLTIIQYQGKRERRAKEEADSSRYGLELL